MMAKNCVNCRANCDHQQYHLAVASMSKFYLSDLLVKKIAYQILVFSGSKYLQNLNLLVVSSFVVNVLSDE